VSPCLPSSRKRKKSHDHRVPRRNNFLICSVEADLVNRPCVKPGTTCTCVRDEQFNEPILMASYCKPYFMIINLFLKCLSVLHIFCLQIIVFVSTPRIDIYRGGHLKLQLSYPGGYWSSSKGLGVDLLLLYFKLLL
jgi:hypothetical protein